MSTKVIVRSPKKDSRRKFTPPPGPPRSAVAAAAYRAGTRLFDERAGTWRDYSAKGRTGVREAFILAPPGSPEWAADRAQLWNRVEAVEKRPDAQLCRDLMIALPHELPHEIRRELLAAFCQANFVDHGMVADIAMHAPSREGDQRNEHAHVMLTMRRIEGDEFGLKAREWNDQSNPERWRADWSARVNAKLAELGIEETIDHRSFASQAEAAGLAPELTPIPTVHLGPSNSAVERKGKTNARIARNIEAKADGRRELLMQARVERLWVLAQRASGALAALCRHALDAIQGAGGEWRKVGWKDVHLAVYREGDLFGWTRQAAAAEIIKHSPGMAGLGRGDRRREMAEARKVDRLREAGMEVVEPAYTADEESPGFSP